MLASVVCDGQWLMRERELLTVDEAEVLALAKEHAQRIASRAGVRLPERFTVVD